jgi:hypothetical protein
MIGAQIGLDLNVVSQSIATVTDGVISVILRITGHSQAGRKAGQGNAIGRRERRHLELRLRPRKPTFLGRHLETASRCWAAWLLAAGPGMVERSPLCENSFLDDD